MSEAIALWVTQSAMLNPFGHVEGLAHPICAMRSSCGGKPRVRKNVAATLPRRHCFDELEDRQGDQLRK